MNSLNKISGEELAVSASVIAALLAKELTTDEENVLGNFLAAIGASLMTIAAQEQNNNSK